ncbi:unnamed protein product [Paramecium octaurelia]|uniref:Uncharacterized protein n=1 Tax=Paramecium octaurelia TaxID=43137 RepID=A0A8S1U359_PAROT|nr:unnamed protein product [Paramecium octaurelia]
MNQSTCSLHDQEEEKYICVHPTCLKKVDNKLCCIQCNLAKHNKWQLNDHQFMNISELEKIALQNYSKLKEHLDNEIEKNTQLRTKTEERLSDVLLSLSTWQNNQKKMFNDITENSSQVLAENIRKAQSLMKSPSLDTYIYFYKLNLLKKQNEIYDIREQSIRQLEYQLNQIEMKRDILINQINFIQREYFLSFAQMDYQIELDNLNNYQFEQCEKHLCQKEVLCTHPNCLQNNPLQLQCSLCFPQVHKEHQQQDYIKTIAIVMKEQEEKKEIIEELKKKFSQNIKKSIDMNLLKINESQQNQYQHNEKQKEKAVFLEQQQLSEFLNPEIPNYIFGHLDQKLLRKTKEQINLYYQQLYYTYESKFSNIFSNQFNQDLEFCTQLDFNSKQFFQYIINLEYELELRQLKLEDLQRTIQSYTLNHQQIEQLLHTHNDSIKNFHSKMEKEIVKLQSQKKTFIYLIIFFILF